MNLIPVSGVPIADSFKGADGSPVIIDRDTGNAYYLVSGAVTKIASPSVVSGAVLTTGDQSIEGVKTFTSPVVIPAATVSGEAVNLGQIGGVEITSGTWTPTVKGSTNGLETGTYSYQVGSYTRVGKRIFFDIAISWSALNGTGNASVKLPFTSTSLANYVAITSSIGSVYTLPASTTLCVAINPSSGYATLYSAPVGGGSLSLLAIDTSASIYVSGSYLID